MKKEDRNRVKKIIEDYEYYLNGFNKTCGNDVKVVNLHRTKLHYICDVILNRRNVGSMERINDCEYPIDLDRIKLF